MWFRESTRRQAEPLGITGHAVNLPDGSVEVLACGDEEALETLAGWLNHGPGMASVTRVERSEVDSSCPASFRSG